MQNEIRTQVREKLQEIESNSQEIRQLLEELENDKTDIELSDNLETLESNITDYQEKKGYI